MGVSSVIGAQSVRKKILIILLLIGYFRQWSRKFMHMQDAMAHPVVSSGCLDVDSKLQQTFRNVSGLLSSGPQLFTC